MPVQHLQLRTQMLKKTYEEAGQTRVEYGAPNPLVYRRLFGVKYVTNLNLLVGVVTQNVVRHAINRLT